MRGHRGLRQRPGDPGGGQAGHPLRHSRVQRLPGRHHQDAGKVCEDRDAGGARRQKVPGPQSGVHRHGEPGAGGGAGRPAGGVPEGPGPGRPAAGPLLRGEPGGLCPEPGRRLHAGPERQRGQVPAHPRLRRPRREVPFRVQRVRPGPGEKPPDPGAHLHRQHAPVPVRGGPGHRPGRGHDPDGD